MKHPAPQIQNHIDSDFCPVNFIQPLNEIFNGRYILLRESHQNNRESMTLVKFWKAEYSESLRTVLLLGDGFERHLHSGDCYLIDNQFTYEELNYRMTIGAFHDESNLAPESRFIAMDKSGKWYQYFTKPTVEKLVWGIQNNVKFRRAIDLSFTPLDWKDSLIEVVH